MCLDLAGAAVLSGSFMDLASWREAAPPGLTTRGETCNSLASVVMGEPHTGKPVFPLCLVLVSQREHCKLKKSTVSHGLSVALPWFLQLEH